MADALELLLLLKAKDDGASPEIDRVRGKLGDAKKGADDAGKSGEAMGQRFNAGATVAKVAIAGLVAGLGALAVKGVMAASDLSEAQNKVNVVFGESAAAIEAFSQSAAQSLGLSRSEALSAAGTFGNLFVAMGIGQEKSADMSKGILTLAADLGSFNNIPVTDALEKLRAGLVGETEPLRALGVNLSAASVETRALEMGFKKVGGELSASAKAQASYALILEQTKTAQGDFANTSTGMANSMKIIQASFGDIVAEIGGALLPLVAPMISAFAQGLPGAFKATKEALSPVFDGLGLLVQIVQTLASGQGFDALYERMNTMMGLDMAGWLAGPIDAFANFRAGIEENGDAVGGFIQSLEPDLSGAIKNIQALWEAVWPHLQEVLGAAWKLMGIVVENAWNIISGIVKVGLALLSGNWEGAWNHLVDMVKTAGDNVGKALNVVFTELLPGVLKGAWEVLTRIGGGIVEAILEGLKAAWGGVTSWLGDRLRDLKDTVAKANPLIGLGMQIGEGIGGMLQGGQLGGFLGGAGDSGYRPGTDTVGFGYAGPEAARRALLQNAGYDPDRSIEGQLQAMQQMERANAERQQARNEKSRRRAARRAENSRLQSVLSPFTSMLQGFGQVWQGEFGGEDLLRQFSLMADDSSDDNMDESGGSGYSSPLNALRRGQLSAALAAVRGGAGGDALGRTFGRWQNIDRLSASMGGGSRLTDVLERLADRLDGPLTALVDAGQAVPQLNSWAYRQAALQAAAGGL